MRLYEVKPIIQGKPDDEDISTLLGARKGTITAGQLRKLMAGHEDHESVQPENNGDGVWITDWTKTKMGTFRTR